MIIKAEPYTHDPLYSDRTYSCTSIPKEKRDYEKMYEATTGKVSHKILIELDQEQEIFVRKLAEKNHTSISRIAECMISHSIWRMTGWEKAMQTPVEYTTSEQK